MSPAATARPRVVCYVEHVRAWSVQAPDLPAAEREAERLSMTRDGDVEVHDADGTPVAAYVQGTRREIRR